ncbi:HK97-gp10 family putative phage morphogenesis protein [Thermodesulfitimonas autotrophica]|uniref:HK97-gp10 family putative phage morphogenesis protein n=1 Tax=Thermodesulfitimonas autotrophica TaxID=1894989 RepID=UPI002FE3AB2C
MTIKIEVEGGKELAKKFAEIGQMATNAAEKALVRAGLLVERDAKKLCPVDTGRLRTSISHRLTGAGTKNPAVEVGTNVEYAPYVEFGTRPHYPPPRALRRWAQLHGMKPGAEFAIARKIAARGTPAKPFLFPAFNANKDKVKQLVAEAIRKELGVK